MRVQPAGKLPRLARSTPEHSSGCWTNSRKIQKNVPGVLRTLSRIRFFTWQGHTSGPRKSSKNTGIAGLILLEEGVTLMLTRIRHQVVCPWIRRPKRAAFVVALFAALATSSAFAQCGGGSGGTGGRGGGAGGSAGASLAGLGSTFSPFGMTGRGQSGQNGAGFFSIPSEQMFQPAFRPIVDDNRQYLAERRALRAAKAEQARQRLAARKERPAKHRTVAVNTPQE